jgi:3-methylcrotonyl-CoA carboxylase alpha subunit
MAAAGALHLLAPPAAAARSEPSPWDARDGFQLTGPREVTLPLDVDGETMMASVRYASGGPSVAVEGEGPAGDAVVLGVADAGYVSWHGWQSVVRLKTIDRFDAAHLGEGGRVTAPMHGKLIEVLVAAGAAVRKGQRLAVIEAMKMEHALVAPMDGRVAELRASVGDQVAEGALLMTIEAAAEHG